MTQFLLCGFLGSTGANMSRVWGGTAFAKCSAAMKAPVGLLSDRTVCVSRWRDFAPTSSMQVSVEDEIRNHRLTDISHNMISGGHEHEV